MATKTHARVLIIGGSVAGLTLANAFEQTGIDYLLLEQWHEIAPDVGASIAIFPNGARILDQLGCYDQSIRLLDGADAFDLIQTKEEDGGVISFVPNGYTPFFTDRQMVIRTLYDNLKDKTRILMSQKVVRVEQTADTVKVFTKVGETYSAEVLIGADGIHSKVRREMWRLAANKLPGYFQSGEGESVRTQYCCIFGISKPIDKFPKQCSYYVRGNGHSYLCSIGPGNRIYWFLFKKLKKPVYGLYEKIPRYDEAELEALVSEHVNDPIGEGMCFGDLYRMRKVATLQALPEVVFSKWHYGRIITIGNAAHKFNLIGGQGGNSAIEDAAVLTNELLKLLESESSETSHLTTSSLENAFQRMQSKRHARTEGIMSFSAFLQRLNAKDFWLGNLITRFMPKESHDKTVTRILASCKPAAKLDTLPVPKRERTECFNDEKLVEKHNVNKRYLIAGSILVGAIAWTTVKTYNIVKAGGISQLK